MVLYMRKKVTWKGYIALVGSGLVTLVWSVTLYFTLVTNRIIASPWVL